MTNLWNPEVQMMPQKQLKELQRKKIMLQLCRVYENSNLYRRLFDKAKVNLAKIKSLEDFSRAIPTMSKDDLREEMDKSGDPFAGALCVPINHLWLINRSTGTTGRPNIFGITKKDHNIIVESFIRFLYGIGMRKGDRSVAAAAPSFQGFASQVSYAQYKLGVGVFQVTERHQMPSYPKELFHNKGLDLTVVQAGTTEHVAPYIEKHNLIPKEIFPNLRFVWHTTGLTQTQREIEEKIWGVPLRFGGHTGDQYVATYQCDSSYEKGDIELHFPEDLFYIEMLHPETREPVGPGEIGELTLTNLWAEACPYIRYRLEDIGVYTDEPCKCGNNHKRLRFKGRLAWSINVKGKIIFVDEVENILWKYEETKFQKVQLIKQKKQPQEHLMIRTCHKPISDEPSFKNKLSNTLKEELGIPVQIELIEPQQIKLKGSSKFEKVLQINEEM